MDGPAAGPGDDRRDRHAPDVWEKAEAGVVDFTITVDGSAGFSAILDVARRVGDRRWVEFSFEVPASARLARDRA